jgi:hypothetical protein
MFPAKLVIFKLSIKMIGKLANLAGGSHVWGKIVIEVSR